MKLIRFGLLTIAVVLIQPITAINTGAAPGLAAGTTGGGNAAPVCSATIEQLRSYLSDSQPRVIILNRAFDFRGSEGTKTEIGCHPIAHRNCINMKNGHKDQDVILQEGGMKNTGGCDDGVPQEVTYDITATTNRLLVRDNKTLRGDGLKGVIIGKGIWIQGNNVVVQNGGDTIYIQGTAAGATQERVWIDHVKVSLIGREMMSTDAASSKMLTISNSEFDGETPYSAACDDRHYWTFIIEGSMHLSLLNNYIHHTSSRSPKLGGLDGANVFVHAANNYWYSNSGFSFEVQSGATALIEGDYFQDSTDPNLHGSKTTGYAFVPTASTQSLCTQYLGRQCVLNTLANSGTLTGQGDNTAAASSMKGVAGYKPSAPKQLSSSTVNFDVGNLPPM